MTKRLFLRLMAALASLAVVPAFAAEPAQRDWTRTVALTPEGGFRMGNPAAKVKVVEYASMTCPHCADFSVQAKQPLAAYVRSGKVSFELRNYVLNPLDASATLVARCAGTAGFFPLTERLFATQASWAGKVYGLGRVQTEQLNKLPIAQRLVRFSQIAGLAPYAAQAGVGPARMRQCVADPAGLQRIGKMGEAAAALGVMGTPTFFINGANIGTHSWATLEPILREAAG